MGTISKGIAERVMAGEFDRDDPRKIVRYTNKWGGTSYGLVLGTDDPDRYRASEFVRNPEVIWERKHD